MTFDTTSMFIGMPITTVLAYAARTFPMPSNVYAKWTLGVIQYVLGNKEQGDKNFKGDQP